MGPDTPSDSSLATRLKRLRERSGLSQRALQALIDGECTHAYLGKIERGEAERPSAEVALRLAKTFGVRVEWLMHGEGPSPRAATVRAAVERAKAERAAAQTPAPEAAQ